jgi:hypothetical protein
MGNASPSWEASGSGRSTSACCLLATVKGLRGNQSVLESSKRARDKSGPPQGSFKAEISFRSKRKFLEIRKGSKIFAFPQEKMRENPAQRTQTSTKGGAL